MVEINGTLYPWPATDEIAHPGFWLKDFNEVLDQKPPLKEITNRLTMLGVVPQDIPEGVDPDEWRNAVAAVLKIHGVNPASVARSARRRRSELWPTTEAASAFEQWLASIA